MAGKYDHSNLVGPALWPSGRVACRSRDVGHYVVQGYHMNERQRSGTAPEAGGHCNVASDATPSHLVMQHT